jgi:hypothetical protein
MITGLGVGFGLLRGGFSGWAPEMLHDHGQVNPQRDQRARRFCMITLSFRLTAI